MIVNFPAPALRCDLPTAPEPLGRPVHSAEIIALPVAFRRPAPEPTEALPTTLPPAEIARTASEIRALPLRGTPEWAAAVTADLRNSVAGMRQAADRFKQTADGLRRYADIMAEHAGVTAHAARTLRGVAEDLPKASGRFVSGVMAGA